jgi:hypothetical protein
LTGDEPSDYHSSSKLPKMRSRTPLRTVSRDVEIHEPAKQNDYEKVFGEHPAHRNLKLVLPFVPLPFDKSPLQWWQQFIKSHTTWRVEAWFRARLPGW